MIVENIKLVIACGASVAAELCQHDSHHEEDTNCKARGMHVGQVRLGVSQSLEGDRGRRIESLKALRKALVQNSRSLRCVRCCSQLNFRVLIGKSGPFAVLL